MLRTTIDVRNILDKSEAYEQSCECKTFLDATELRVPTKANSSQAQCSHGSLALSLDFGPTRLLLAKGTEGNVRLQSAEEWCKAGVVGQGCGQPGVLPGGQDQPHGIRRLPRGMAYLQLFPFFNCEVGFTWPNDGMSLSTHQPGITILA